MDIGTLVAKITADVSGFKAGIGQVQSGMKSATTSTNNFAGGLIKLAAVTAAVYGVVRFLKDCTKEYQDAEAAQAKLVHAVVDVTGATQDQLQATMDLIDQLEIKGVLDGDVIKAGVAQLSTFGLSNKAVRGLSESLADLTVNQYGVNASSEQCEASANMMAKALNGQFGVLEKSGIRFTEAQKQLIKFGTEEEKVTAINEGFAQNLKYTNEIAMQTSEGMRAHLIVQMGNMKETIGKVVTGAIDPLLRSFSKWIDNMGGASGVIKYLTNLVADHIGVITFLATVISTVLVAAFAKWALAAAAAAVTTAIAWAAANPILAIGGLIVAGAATIWATTSDLKGKIKGAINDITSSVEVGNAKQLTNTTDTYEDEAAAHEKKTKQIKEDLEEENEAYAESCAKRKRTFEENMASLVKDHLAKKKSLEDDIADENDDFNESMEDIKSNYTEDMDTLKENHAEKVEKIQEQIDAETAKGLDADATILASFQTELAEENAEYDAQVIKKDADYKKEVDKETKRHQEALLAFAEQLDAENAILEKHADEVAQFKDAVVLDDIERLKRSYAEENAEAQKQHEKKLADLYKQGYEETEAYNKGKEQRNAEDTNKAIQNAGNNGAAIGKAIASAAKTTPIITPSPIAGSSATLNSGVSIFSSISNWVSGAISSVGSWLDSLRAKPPEFDVGGIVPGQIGSRQLVIAHGGETILPTHKQGFTSGNNITISMAGANISSPGVAEAYAEMIGDTIMKKLSRSTRA